eukprot:g1118.t1
MRAVNAPARHPLYPPGQMAATPPASGTPLTADASPDALRAAVAQRDSTIAALKARAKQFVAQMRGQLAAEKVKVQQMEALAQERQRTCEAQMEELVRLRAAVAALTAESAERHAALNDQAVDKSAADTIERQSATIADLSDELTNLRKAQESSTELLAAANAKSREKQAALDGAKSARREAQDALEAAESELEEARLAAEDARHEMQQTANQAALQQAASQQVLSDTRAMVTSLEKERDILAAKLNEIRVQSKDGSLKLEEDLRVARKGLLAMQEEMQKQKASFAQKRELAKTKFMELVARADDAEHVAQEAKAKATQAAENLVNKESEMAGRIAYLEGTLKVVTMERDKALEAQEVCTDGADADRERLIASLATTQAELKEQRQKRLVAKNEILTMVRQLDANRDSMSTLFTQLQQLVTKTGTFVIECRSMETKCDDALIALDIEADMDV